MRFSLAGSMRSICKLSAVALLSVMALLAQATSTGALNGRITDAQGRGVANANIVITEVTSGRSMRATTGADGAFTMSDLQPGSYRVEIEANGMRRTGGQNVDVTAGGPSNIEVVFANTSTTTSSTGQDGEVEIKASAPTIQTDSAEASRSYGTRIMRSLPVLDRQYQEFISLMPGVTPPVTNQDRVQDPQRRRIYNVNGLPSYANIEHQDGAFNGDTSANEPIRVSPIESVQALNVRTSNYNAEYGFAGGAWSNVVTRPGTNAVHGSLFGFHTNNYLMTRNPLLPNGFDNPRMNQNQYGGTVGFPVIGDRMFFFMSYEGFMRRGRTTELTAVPSSQFAAGNFSGLTIYDPATGLASGTGRTPFAGGQIPANRINPFARAFLNNLPAANTDAFGTGGNNFVGYPILRDDNHRADGKLDYRFTDRTYGFLRYGFTQGSVNQGSALGLLGGPAQAELRNHSAVASISSNFSESLLGEFRFGYHRYRNQIGPWGDFTALNNDFAPFGFTNGIPEINIAGLGSFGYSGNFARRPVTNTWNGATNWTWHNGMHNLKFGADVRRINAFNFDPGFFSPAGSFNFGPGATGLSGGLASQNNLLGNSFASFLIGAPGQAGVANFQGTPEVQQTLIGGYLTDTIRLWNRLHLELGVRYDVYRPTRLGPNTLYNVGANTANNFDYRNVDSDTDYNNIAPRVGFAFTPWRNIAVRGGYGIQFFPVPYSLLPVNNAVSGAQTGFNGGFGTVPFQTPTVPNLGVTNQAGNFPYYSSADSDPRTPYIHSYSLMVQADLGDGFLFDVGFVGNQGRQLPFNRALVGLPGTGTTGLPVLGRTAPIFERGVGLNSNYNALQVNLTKRFETGLSIAGAYTFSRAQDYGFDQFDPYNRANNYAVSDFDRRHILTFTHAWQLPFGAGSRYFAKGWAANILGNWELNGILRWATGTPYSITGDPTFCACPGLSGVPVNYTGTSNFEGSASFDPSLFSTAQTGFGNAGRNQFRGPELFVYNLGLFKNFTFAERAKLELRGEAYNLTNSTNYANPVSRFGAVGFGRANQTFNGLGGRQFQVGARVVF